jgi:hypothetical protein
MKIINEIVCNLNWIKDQFISIQMIKIWFELNWNKNPKFNSNTMKWLRTTKWNSNFYLNSNSIDRKCNAKGIRNIIILIRPFWGLPQLHPFKSPCEGTPMIVPLSPTHQQDVGSHILLKV